MALDACRSRKACIPLWNEFITSKIASLVDFLVEVCIFGLDSIGSEKDGSLWRAVNIIIQDALLHLKEEEALRDILN